MGDQIPGITDQPIDCAALRRLAGDDRAGAVVTFVGAVRNHDAGRQVEGIDYVAHPSAGQAMAQVVAEARRADGVYAVVAQHRVGALGVGDVALYVAVAAAHREQAFRAASGLVDRIKEVLPVWKKQLFPDGTHEWTGCP